MCSVIGCEKTVLAKTLCQYHYHKNYRNNNKEYFYKKKNDWANKNKMASRAWRLKNNYGITLEEYDNMLVEQNGVCAICFKENNGRLLVVDHNHITGNVRGLLCDACNSGIGTLKTDEGIQLLINAIEYINKRDAR